MTAPSNWRDVKARARAADPAWDSAARTARRAEMRGRMLASVSGAQLGEIRGQLGLTQASISQIENGTATGLEVLRTHITGLSGHPFHP
ncbi:XRE family transcriptional regulator [Frankia sp. AgPm24]|uniref:XRE family transcriptional regulator n=1 Tax=Frankia sp. AgPm24 TaxID=631128 RepID=UPI00200CDCF9|nr:XRE family transcriptional regulator [Frankia sp. AgPm24]MCK9923656.1 XRE family transcriptional regulator [Frankia sp. AgPm24]